MNSNDMAVRIMLGMTVLLPAVMLGSLFLPRALPWWGDGGDWLKISNAILGNTYPMWEQSTFQYPPLFLVLVALVSRAVGEVLALKLLSIIAYCLIPLSTYFFVKELMKDRLVALGSAWLAVFTPVWIEMLGWGGYPDLLGLAVLPFAFYGIVRLMRKRTAANFAVLALGSFLVPITHHLTFLTFVGVLALWGVFSLAYERKAIVAIGASAGVTLATFVAYRLLAGPAQFLLYNAAAESYLQTNGQMLLYMFKSQELLAILYLSALGAAALIATDPEYRTAALLLIAWTVFPLAGTQGYLLGLALDYNRVLFFFAQPFMVLVAVPFIYRARIARFLTSGRVRAEVWEMRGLFKIGSKQGTVAAKHILAIFVLALSLGAVFYTPIVGAQTAVNVNDWYNNPTVDPYGDQQKLQVVNYIDSTTPSTAVVVAENTMGRWIEGLGQRRVMLELDPRFLFITGEVEREYAARAIYDSYRGIRNSYAWVFDQAPYGNLSSVASFYYNGEYSNLVYLNDSGTTVSWLDTQSGKNYTMPLSNSTSVTSSWAERDGQAAAIMVDYTLGPVQVTREVRLSGLGNNITYSFMANSTNPLVSIANMSVSMLPWPGNGPVSAMLVANRTLLEQTPVGPLYIYSSASRAFPFTFEADRLTNSASGTIALWSVGKGSGGAFATYDRSELISQFGVTDIVLPNTETYTVPVGAPIGIGTRFVTLPEYQNLLEDPSFHVLYYNDRAIVIGTSS